MYLPTSVMPADDFTKALPAHKIRGAISLIGMGDCCDSRTESADLEGYTG